MTDEQGPEQNSRVKSGYGSQDPEIISRPGKQPLMSESEWQGCLSVPDLGLVGS